jgi:hypothetical protein
MPGSVQPKPRPTLDLDLVLHPQHDTPYVHFEAAADVPFDATATIAHRRNAWWLADAALLTYWDEATVKSRLANAGFTARCLSHEGVQCYVATTTGAALVAFRGTEPDQWPDVLDDIKAVLVPWDRPQTFVHQGFKDSLNRIWSRLQPLLADAADRPIWFAGHSLGAALATLAADRWPSSAGVVTIGSPRVGDRAFVAQFDRRFGPRSARYVNNTDIVTHLPPPLPLPLPFPPSYDHVEAFRQIASDGTIASVTPRLHHFAEELFGTGGPVADLMTNLRDRPGLRAPRFVLDHMPKSYAVDIWNDFVVHGD